MNDPVIKLLVKVAAFTGFFVAGTGYYLRSCIDVKLKKSEYYQESLKILKSHKGIAHYMGTPILEGKLNLDDRENNYCTEKEARFEVPVKGSKREGTLYLYALKEDNSPSLKVQRLELGLEDTPGKRILVFDSLKSEK